MIKYSLILLLLISTTISIGQTKTTTMDEKKDKTEQQWMEELGYEKYQVLRQCGTEPPFTGKYVNHKEDGNYYCAGCGTKLFSSSTKFDSGSGWPSFTAEADSANIKKVLDESFGMTRTEIKCSNCDGHLGHLFNDGPGPDGYRYCVNSASLDFDKK